MGSIAGARADPDRGGGPLENRQSPRQVTSRHKPGGGKSLWVAYEWGDSESAADKLGNRRVRGMSLRWAQQDGGRPGLSPSGLHRWLCRRAGVFYVTKGMVLLVPSPSAVIEKVPVLPVASEYAPDQPREPPG